MKSILAILSLIAFSVPGWSREGHSYNGEPAPLTADTKAPELQGVGIEEKLGASLDRNLKFRDENNREVTLGSYFDGKTPVIISPVYFSCPGLCNFHLNGLTDGLKALDWNMGEKYKVLSISFDHTETPQVAGPKKENYLKVYERPQAKENWHFLTGDEASVKALMASIGFKYKWNEQAKEWAHASAAIVVSPNGTLTRYLPGILFEAKDIKLALTEAGKGKVGSLVDQLILYCFHYNPQQSKYTLYAFNIVKAGGGIMILILAMWLLPVWVRARRHPSSMRSS